jgi:hypothetical protein
VLEPEGGEIAAGDGFALRIGQRAAPLPTPGAKVYGLGSGEFISIPKKFIWMA